MSGFADLVCGSGVRLVSGFRQVKILCVNS